MGLALLCAVLSGKGCRTPSREYARNRLCLLGVVYISGIWLRFWGLRNVCCIELLRVGVKTGLSRAPPAMQVWEPGTKKVARSTQRGGVERLLPQCRFIYFFLHRVKWKQKQIKFKKNTGGK